MHKQIKRFEILMEKIGVPKQRQDCTYSNVLWFIKSGAILYRNNRYCEDAITLAKTLLQTDGLQHHNSLTTSSRVRRAEPSVR